MWLYHYGNHGDVQPFSANFIYILNCVLQDISNESYTVCEHGEIELDTIGAHKLIRYRWW